MIDLDVLEAKGVSVEKLKKIFDGKRRDELPDNVQKLVDRLRHRVQTGIQDNLTNYKVYHALDLAWDVPFRQVSHTLLQSIEGKDPSDESVNNMLKEWGLTSLISLRDIEDPKTGKKSKAIDLPAFFRISVPLVRSYVTIRWAKITNDRKLTPFFKYEPAKDTSKNRLRGEVITDRIQKISTQYGYFDVLKQAVFHMLHYSFCLQFPVEEWHSEEQLVREKDGDEPKVKVVKEGIRYHLPHPNRTFWDKAHRVSTFNSDTGCCYAGYWRVFRYGEILSNKQWWNTENISIGAQDWARTHTLGFITSTAVNTMKFPQSFLDSADGMSLDRESLMEKKVYTTELSDTAVTLTEYFEKLVPSEWGLGKYDYPVWFRFVVASDDTVIYAAPLPYAPVVYYGYDAHEGRSQNASLSLEVQPFQDQVSNLLTQMLLTTKQNLTNVTFVDTDQVDEKEINKLENFGERLFRSLNFIRFSSRKFRSGQQNVNDAFKSARFPNMDTTSVVSAIRMVLDILERTLVMSSQEVAQAASHEQTREEVRQIATTTSSRLLFTAQPVDLAIAAWKHQLYQGLMAYGEAESYVSVDGDTLDEVSEDDLKALGFSVEEHAEGMGRKAIVRVDNKTALALEDFTSTREGEDRLDNVAAATSMSNFLIGLLNNPLIAPAIGAEQAITMMNLIARLSGFPRDFKLKVTDDPKMREQQDAEARNELMKVAQETAQKASQEAAMQSQQVIMQQVGASLEEVKKGFQPIVQALKQEMEKDQQQDQAIAAITNTLQEVEKVLAAINQHPPAPAPMPMPPPGPGQMIPPGMEQGNVTPPTGATPPAGPEQLASAPPAIGMV